MALQVSQLVNRAGTLGNISASEKLSELKNVLDISSQKRVCGRPMVGAGWETVSKKCLAKLNTHGAELSTGTRSAALGTYFIVV